MPNAPPPPLLAVGRVARAHGIKGRVLVAPFNDQSEGLERATALWLGKPGEAAKSRFGVKHAERVDLGYLFALDGVTDRNVSETLRGLEVGVARDELPELEEDELFAADLIGLAVYEMSDEAVAGEPGAGPSSAEHKERAGAIADEPLGHVIALESAGPNELLVIKLRSGAQVLAPIDFVREVDLEGKRLWLHVPEGLFDVQLRPAGPPEGDQSDDGSDVGPGE